jgi:adenylate kinase family enzyme
VGCIGAGKSTMARALGAKLDIEVFHLDRLWWEPGEYRITGKRTVAARTMAADDFRRAQEEIARRDSWVIDGGAADLDVRLSRADTVVFLDLPRWVCTWQLLKRHNRGRPDYPEGVREGVGWLVLLVRWVWCTYPTKRRPSILKAIEEHAGGASISWLRTRAEVRSFLASLDGSS